MTVAIIPARGGSRRIPNKNKRLFFGVPMIKYAIKAAKDSLCFDHIVVSTDDDEIFKIADQCACIAHKRELEMCRDEVGTQEVAKHVLSWFNWRITQQICVIYPCVPLLNPTDLAVSRMLLNTQNECYYVMSVGDNPHLHDAGQFYWGFAESFVTRTPLVDRYTRMYPVPENRDCDINTEEDWQRAERMYQGLIADRFDGRQTV